LLLGVLAAVVVGAVSAGWDAAAPPSDPAADAVTEARAGVGMARAGSVGRAGAGGDDLDGEPGPHLAPRPWMEGLTLAPAGGGDPAPDPAPAAPDPAPGAALGAAVPPLQRRPEVADAIGAVWTRLAQCESGGEWGTATGNGYYGGLQFDLPTWRDFGGTAYAPRPHEASREEQVAVASRVRDARGGYGAWPACAAELGLPR
jgi:hypothetical protein